MGEAVDVVVLGSLSSNSYCTNQFKLNYCICYQEETGEMGNEAARCRL